MKLGNKLHAEQQKRVETQKRDLKNNLTALIKCVLQRALLAAELDPEFLAMNGNFRAALFEVENIATSCASIALTNGCLQLQPDDEFLTAVSEDPIPGFDDESEDETNDSKSE